MFKRALAFLRAMILPLVLIVYTGFMSALAVVFVFIFRNRKIDTFIIRAWSLGICKAVGLKLNVEGLGRIPEGSVLFVFNHQSLLDIPVIHSAIPKDFRFGAKIELYRIPIFGAAMRALGALPIARSQRSDAIDVLKQAALRMQSGESFVLAPEGTRQKENRVAEFKSGPFMLSLASGRPIVPVVIKNISKVLPRKGFLIHHKELTSVIQLRILPPIWPSNYSHHTRGLFRRDVRECMVKEYESIENGTADSR